MIDYVCVSLTILFSTYQLGPRRVLTYINVHTLTYRSHKYSTAANIGLKTLSILSQPCHR